MPSSSLERHASSDNRLERSRGELPQGSGNGRQSVRRIGPARLIRRYRARAGARTARPDEEYPFGDNVAVVYGSESSVAVLPDSKSERRCLVWTDTWLKRKGRWQIIAVQDARIDCPPT